MIGPPNIAAENLSMQLRDLVVGRNIGVLVEEERRGIEPV